MSGTGELYFAEDEDGRIWRFDLLAGDDAFAADTDAVNDTVRRLDLLVVKETFPDWRALDQRRRQIARNFTRRFTPGTHEPDTLEDVRRGLAKAKAWSADERAPLARKLVHRLLRVPAVRDDDDVHRQLVDLLDDLDELAHRGSRAHSPIAKEGTARLHNYLVGTAA